MKILIIDDEALVRIGMRSIIKWEEHGYIIVGEASDGEMGLELCRKHKPDIILVDILMPKMNGLEFVKQAKKENPHCKFIILSCVNESATYHQAIKLGVSGYILKDTITPEGILEEVERVVEEVKKERIFASSSSAENRYVNENLVMNAFVNMVIQGKISDQKLIKEKLEGDIFTKSDNKMYLVIFEQIQDVDIELDKNFQYKLASFIQDMVTTASNGRVFVSHDDVIWGIIGYAVDQHPENYIINVVKRIDTTLYQYFSSIMKIGIVEIEKMDISIKDKFELCRRTLYQSFFKKDQRIFVGELDDFYDQAKEELLEVIDLCALAKNNDFIIESLEKMYRIIIKYQTFSKIQIKNIYATMINNILRLEEKDYCDLGKALCSNEDLSVYIDTFTEFESLHNEMMNMISLVLSKTRINSEDIVINKITSYIRRHLNTKIALLNIAKEVHLSPEYTCRYFKDKTDMTLTDYILMEKIHVSKKELVGGKSISEIAEQYAFSSDGHYIKTFKRYEGITPRAYARK